MIQQKKTFPFLQGGGEMGELIRNFEWSQTSLNTPDRWPLALQISLSNVLNSGFPMFLFWGEDLTCFYNDAFRPSLGVNGKHPAIGKLGKDVWPEIWDFIGPLIQNVLSTGKPVWFENQLVPFYRNGRMEDIFWTFSYSLLLNDTGQPGGVLVTCMETTDAVNGQKLVVESEARFRNAIEQAPVAIGLTRGDEFIFESINPPMLQIIHKKDKQEVIGKPLSEVLPELVNQPVFNILKNVLQTGETFNGTEVEAQLAYNGVLQLRYFNITYSRVIGQDGIPSVLHMSSDVTEQVLARRKIAESEAKYRSLFESMDQGYCTLEIIFEGDKCVDYRYLETNPTFERHLGMGGALGKTIREIAPEIEPKWFEFYGSVALTGKPIRVEEESKAFNKWFEVYAVRVGRAEEKKVGVFFTDVTVRKKAEEAIRESESRFRILADESPMFVFLIDANPLAPVSYWNKTWLTYTGQTYEEALGRAWDGIFHKDDVTIVMDHYLPAFEKKEPYYIPAIRVKRRDGVYRWHSFKGNPRLSATGEFDGYIGVGFDVHEQKVIEENLEELIAQRTQELQLANTELRRSNQNLEEFAHAASHDLKEPIRKILFFTHQLKDKLGPYIKEDDLRSFNRIENASNRMNNLIDDLLLYSHVSQRPHETEAVDLNEGVQRVLEDLELDIEEKEAIIHVGKLPIIQGFRRQLQQLFQNLISNAIKYSKADEPPIIDISVNVLKEKGTIYNMIAVKDNGIGFDPQYADKIFQMFSRLHGKAEYSGTGVGLSIVKKVVENHDGFIRVKSNPGVGSTFEIYLPR